MKQCDYCWSPCTTWYDCHDSKGRDQICCEDCFMELFAPEDLVGWGAEGTLPDEYAGS